MNAGALTTKIKDLAIESGAVKVGVADRRGLEGPPEADLDEVLAGASHAISFAVVEPEEHIFGYLGKTDPGPYRDTFHSNVQLLGTIGRRIADELNRSGHRAVALSPNGVYAPGSSMAHLIPPFSHRYAAHAAGVGAIALSGNVMAPEYGTRIYLSTVITEAPLKADGPLDVTPCDSCRLCIEACPVDFMSRTETVTFTMGGQEITHARKRSHARCAISCSGFSGLSRDGKWSTLAPSLIEIPEDDDAADRLLQKILPLRLRHLATNPELPNFMRLSEPVEGFASNQQGILARNRHDTHTTCGNCAIVCMETKRQRARALKTLRNSGVVIAENDDGSPVVVTAEEAATFRATNTPPWWDEI